jgi:hypothetical protein
MAPGRRLLDKREGDEFPFRYRSSVDTDIRRIRSAAQSPSVIEAERILSEIRLLRDAFQPGEIRSALNAAWDRMDVATSKIYEAEKCQK